MKIYLAGPMRGIPEFNFPAFKAAAEKLRAEGHEVFSPAERDNERHGTNISAGNMTGCEAHASAQHGFSLREALGDDMAWITAHAEAIYLLPGWQNSTGANAERALGVALGLQIVELPGEKPLRALPTIYLQAMSKAANRVFEELERARQRYGRFNSSHEGYGVILEELDELWDDIKRNDRDAAKKEAVQVCAMALSYLTDLYTLEELS